MVLEFSEGCFGRHAGFCWCGLGGSLCAQESWSAGVTTAAEGLLQACAPPATPRGSWRGGGMGSKAAGRFHGIQTLRELLNLPPFRQ